MKKPALYILLLLTFLSCNANKHMEGSEVGMANIDQDFEPRISNISGENFMVFTSGKDFDNNFESVPGRANMHYPDFKGQTVVACTFTESAGGRFPAFVKATITGRQLNVYIALANSSHIASYTAVAAVPKNEDVKMVNFILDGQKVKTLPIVKPKENNSDEAATATREAKKIWCHPMVI